MPRKARAVTTKQIRSFHVGVAAEAIAAAQFARCGFDVSVQYGANQPEYDLIISDGPQDLTMKVSVKGSQDGAWGLTQSYLKKANYHGAVDLWLLRHKPRTVCCFVQFKGAELKEMPRVYLATTPEVAQVLKGISNAAGGTILYEKHEWTSRAKAAGTKESIPDEWAFTKERVNQLLQRVDGRVARAAASA